MINVDFRGLILIGIVTLAFAVLSAMAGGAVAFAWAHGQNLECERFRDEASRTFFEAGATLGECLCAVCGECR